MRVFHLRWRNKPREGTMRLTSLLVSIALIAGLTLIGHGGNAMSKVSSATAASEKKPLELLFSAVLQYRSASERDAVVPANGRDGAYRKWGRHGHRRPASRNHELVALVRGLRLSAREERASYSRRTPSLHPEPRRFH